MITPSEYTIMGEDGKEYGPVDDAQVRQWIREGRAGAKTPIKPAHVRDWVFLADLPEFASLFQIQQPLDLPRSPQVRKGLRNAAIVVFILVALYYLFTYLLSLKRH